MIKVHIPVVPTPWSAPIIRGRRAHDPRESHKRFVRLYLQTLSIEKLMGYVAIKFTFTFPLPKALSAAKKSAMLAGKILPTKSDCTNLQKLYEDCLKGILIEDDRKVAKIFSEKVYGERIGVDVYIFKLEEFPHVFSS